MAGTLTSSELGAGGLIFNTARHNLSFELSVHRDRCTALHNGSLR